MDLKLTAGRKLLELVGLLLLAGGAMLIVGSRAGGLGLAGAPQTPGLSPPAAAATQTNGHFESGGIVFDYPSSWVPFDKAAMNVSWMVAFSSAGPTAECCLSLSMVPDSLVVSVARGSRPDFDVTQYRPQNATVGTVGGAVLVREVGGSEPNVSADMRVTYTVGLPQLGTPYYVASALIRGPDTAQLQAQLDGMMQSVRLTPP